MWNADGPVFGADDSVAFSGGATTKYIEYNMGAPGLYWLRSVGMRTAGNGATIPVLYVYNGAQASVGTSKVWKYLGASISSVIDTSSPISNGNGVFGHPIAVYTTDGKITLRIDTATGDTIQLKTLIRRDVGYRSTLTGTVT